MNKPAKAKATVVGEVEKSMTAPALDFGVLIGACFLAPIFSNVLVRTCTGSRYEGLFSLSIQNGTVKERVKRETLRNLLFQIVTTEIIRHLQYMYTVCSTTSSLSLSPPTCCNPPEWTIWYIPVQTPLPLPSPGGTFPTESHNPRPILFKKVSSRK